MNKKIDVPDEEWATYIAEMWLLGSQISEDLTGEKMDGSLGDLNRLQQIVNSSMIEIENPQKLQSLGIVLGKVFIKDTPDFDWWVVEDEYGKDACIRYKETTLLIFPRTMISKRIEDGEKLDIHYLYGCLTEEVERIKNENYSNF